MRVEPFFFDYLRWDLERALVEAGFSVERTEPAFLSKVVVARAVGPHGSTFVRA